MNKFLLVISLILLSNFAQAFTFSFNEVLLKKDLKNPVDVYLTAYSSVQMWCLLRGTAFDVNSYQAAQAFDKLEDGIYRCHGQFSQLMFEPIHSYQIDKCEKLDREELKLQCEKPR